MGVAAAQGEWEGAAVRDTRHKTQLYNNNNNNDNNDNDNDDDDGNNTVIIIVIIVIMGGRGGSCAEARHILFQPANVV